MEAVLNAVEWEDSQPSEGSESPLNSLLHTLKSQAVAALAEDSRVKQEVEGARRVLVRTAEAAASALERLAHAEEQLEYKWAKLAALLSEVKQLERERHEALMLAQQLGSLEAEGGLPEISEGEFLRELEMGADTQHMPVPESGRGSHAHSHEEALRPVAELRSALKQVVHAHAHSRLR